MIEHILKPIARWYRRGDVEEVFLNRFQEVTLKMRDGSWQTHEDPALDRDYIYHRLCRVLANLNRSPIDVDNPDSKTIPIVSCQIPGESFRFQAVLGNKVIYNRTDADGAAIAIRALSTQELDFGDFGLVEGKPLPSATKHVAQAGRYSEDALKDLICTLENNQGVIVSGPTSTGKTSFTQRVIKQIPLDRRVITVEDTHELDVPHPNHVHLLGPRNKGAQGMGYNEILDAVVRLTPDVLIGGELSITNASAFLRIMTTGHANFITTIHADSPKSALRAFVQNIARNNEQVDYQMSIDVICGSIGRIVQLGRADGMRRVTAIEIPANMNRDELKEFISAPAAAAEPGRQAHRRAPMSTTSQNPARAILDIAPLVANGHVVAPRPANDYSNPVTSAKAPPIAAPRSSDVHLIGATLLGMYAQKLPSSFTLAGPFEERLIPPLAERFGFARAFCSVIVESERFIDPLIKKHAALLLSVIATCLITGPEGEARSTRYQDIGAILISVTGARPCMHLTAKQADSLLRFLIDLTQTSALRSIPDVSVALSTLIALPPEALAVIAEIGICAVAGMVGATELVAAAFSDDILDAEVPA